MDMVDTELIREMAISINRAISTATDPLYKEIKSLKHRINIIEQFAKKGDSICTCPAHRFFKDIIEQALKGGRK